MELKSSVCKGNVLVHNCSPFQVQVGNASGGVVWGLKSSKTMAGAIMVLV